MTFEKSRLLKKIPLIFIFFLFSIESAFTQSASYQRIVATPALAVRDSPGVDGRVLVRKYRGDRLTVYSRLEQPVIVNGIRGYWVQVDDGYLSKQEGQKGWVFSGFLSDYRNGPDSLYANALRLEKRDSQRAIHTYRHIMKEYPKAREMLAEDCYGIYADYADNRIKIITCQKRSIPSLTMQQIEEELIRGIREDNYSFLEQISPCQISFDNGRLLWGISPLNISRYLKLSDIDTERISRNPSSIFFYSKTKPLKYYFLFEQRAGGYALSALGYDR